MIKRYHEAPKSIFSKVQQRTQGDYALVHLFETDPEYFNMFKDAVNSGRDVILDNSIFELGESFEHEAYVRWIKALEPTWYIVPDVWKNGEATTRMFFDFVRRYPKLPGKRIGVAQGCTFAEVAKCYEEIEPYCDMIAFNLDFSSYTITGEHGVPYCLRMSIGRHQILTDLYNEGIINAEKPHHLLGCGVPQEIIWYPKSYEWIRSIDTCNPIICGMIGRAYDPALPGMLAKPKAKMCNHMGDAIRYDQWSTIEYNLTVMDRFEALRED